MSPRTLRWAGLGLLVLAGSACRSPEANVYNLRQVREPDGSIRRIGAPMNRFEYLLRQGLLPRLGAANVDLDVGAKEPDVIDDPDGIALESLLQLADCDADDPWVLGLQVEIASWLAVDDGYRLARERAVIELGRLARRLGVREPEQLREDVAAAGPDDLVGPLRDLVAALGPVIQLGAAPGPDLAEACDRVAALPYDRQGARRVVAASNALLERAGRGRPGLEPLEELFDGAARRAVALALGDALLDRDPVVRAAAVEAVLRASDDELVSLRMQALSDPEEIVVVAVLHGIARRGLATPPDVDEATAEEMRLAFVDRLVDLSTDLRGPVSAAACRALARVTDSGIDTLRWEEWTRWWERELAARRVEAPAAGDEPPGEPPGEPVEEAGEAGGGDGAPGASAGGGERA